MGQLLGEKLGLRVFERWCRQVTEKEKTGKNEARIAFQRFQHVFLDWFRPNDWSPLMRKKLSEKLSTDKYVRLETDGSMSWSDIRSKARQEVRDEEFELFFEGYKFRNQRRAQGISEISDLQDDKDVTAFLERFPGAPYPEEWSPIVTELKAFAARYPGSRLPRAWEPTSFRNGKLPRGWEVL